MYLDGETEVDEDKEEITKESAHGEGFLREFSQKWWIMEVEKALIKLCADFYA